MARGRPRTLSDEDRVVARRAQQQVARAVKRGDLVRPDACACGGAPVQGHHADYSKPLEVEWLCAMCHRRRHGGQAVSEDGLVQVSFRLDPELVEQIDAVAGGNRAGFMRWALMWKLGLVEGPYVPGVRPLERNPEFVRPADGRYRPKVERLEVARAVKSSAEAKAGLRPLNDWRGGDDAA